MNHHIGALVAAAIRRRRPGSVLAVVAVSLVALVSVIALAIDVGMLYSARGEAQRAADAAALAGASAFLDLDPITRPGEATALALDRANDYGTRATMLSEQIADSEVTPEVMIASQRVRVTIHRPAVPLIFARIFGMQTSGVTAVATAEAVFAGSSSCVKPFAIPDLWAMPGPGEDIYNRGAGVAPIWDFDAHLLPNKSITDTGLCKQQGNKWDCPPEYWDPRTVDSYGDGDYGYGTDVRDLAPDYMGRIYEKDEGRRVPLKINKPGEGGVPSFWFPWRLPGEAGASDLTKAIRGCINDVDVGQGVETETGQMSNPIYTAFIDLIDNGDGVSAPDKFAEWDEATGTIINSAYADNIKASPRVITVALVHPGSITQGMNTMTFVDFATFFLEDPRRVYPDVNPAHHAPITGRLIKFGSGNAGPEQGSLIKRLRLVQ